MSPNSVLALWQLAGTKYRLTDIIVKYEYFMKICLHHVKLVSYSNILMSSAYWDCRLNPQSTIHISVLSGNINAEMLLVPIQRASTRLQGSLFQINSEQEEVRRPNYWICKKINNCFCNGGVTKATHVQTGSAAMALNKNSIFIICFCHFAILIAPWTTMDNFIKWLYKNI